MNDNNFLQNPPTQEFDMGQNEMEVPERIVQAEGQLTLEKRTFSTRLKQFISWLRIQSRRKMDELEIAQVWKAIAIPFAITSWFINIVFIMIGGIIFFRSLPPTVPLIYDSLNNRWEQVDKSVIFIFGLFFGISEFVAIQYIFSVFRHDRRLALTYAWMLVFLNILLLIAIIQIFRLIT